MLPRLEERTSSISRRRRFVLGTLLESGRLDVSLSEAPAAHAHASPVRIRRIRGATLSPFRDYPPVLELFSVTANKGRPTSRGDLRKPETEAGRTGEPRRGPNGGYNLGARHGEDLQRAPLGDNCFLRRLGPRHSHASQGGRPERQSLVTRMLERHGSPGYHEHKHGIQPGPSRYLVPPTGLARSTAYPSCHGRLRLAIPR